MEYKVGDIYREKVKVFEDAILCKNKSNRNNKYKLIQMEV